MKVTTAIFPVAGLASRFLPATKSSPKEMMPIVGKPLIQYAVEEAISAGITHLIFVVNKRKRAIQDYFAQDIELEFILEQRKQFNLSALIHNLLPANVKCSYVQQDTPKGLGHAVLCAKQLIKDEPFAVLLADDLIDSDYKPCLQQMMDFFHQVQTNVIAVKKILKSESKNYGLVEVMDNNKKYSLLKNIVEKPHPDAAPSNLGVVGRYILTPHIFNFLENDSKVTDEIQLTDAIAKLLHVEPVYAFQFRGIRYDCGNKLGYLKAIVSYGLKSPDISPAFKKWLLKLIHNKESKIG